MIQPESFSSEIRTSLLLLFFEPFFDLTHSENIMLLRSGPVIFLDPARGACWNKSLFKLRA